MSTDSTDTHFGHLDLSDLIAGAAGQPVGDRARQHLASCGQCQREANRWGLVASGVRDLVADAAAPSGTTQPAQPAQPTGGRRRMLTAPWQRALLGIGSAAAALVLLVGIGEAAGFVHVSLSGPGSETVLSAVTGCSQLQQADGTLERVNGTSLVIRLPSGQPLTVTTTAATFVSTSGSLLSDITDGASVMVRGSTSNGTISAAIVTVGQPFSAVNPTGYVPVQGTVSDASNAGFTLVTSSGARIPVSTSGDTLVVVPHAFPSQLHAGQTILALGQAGPGGTLSARAVAAVSQLHSGGLHIGTTMKVKDCSARSVDEALGTISTAVGSGH